MGNIIKWDKDDEILEKLVQKNLIKENKYGGRHVIQRDSEVLNGVYLSEYPDENILEAIVVDPEVEDSELRKLYEDARSRASVCGELQKEYILEAVVKTVVEAMPLFDDKEVYSILRGAEDMRGRGADKGRKMPVDHFINWRVGNKNKYALACAALLEMFKDDEDINGDISVDRNQVEDENGNVSENVWCRYTNADGEVYILEVVRNELGRAEGFAYGLEKAIAKNSWPYNRPEDGI